MKATLIFSLATSALASAVQFPYNNAANVNAAIAGTLMNRAIDPATMDPTQFSILSVLKTAMPTGPNMPMPSRGVEPVWYKELPEDVKVLLPKFYPVVADAGMGDGGDSEASTTVGDRTSKSEETSVVATSEGMRVLVSTSPSSPSTLTSTLNTAPSSFPSTNHTASTTTSSYSSSPSSSSSSSPTLSLLSSPPSAPTTTASSSPLTSATPSTPFNAGAKASVHTVLLTAVAWISLAMGFYIFA
ncbi:hypothetical protein TW65_06845 [Stemphylium lycopersici]|nr:hypothetical protein TW65_06845 [Stemphylium lycopersici]